MSTGLKRKKMDKFYTSNKIVENCVKFIKEYVDIDIVNDLCIEPSAGNGAFIFAIKSLFNNYKFYDLEPEHNEIMKKDYLKYTFNNDLKKKYRQVHIIGNPPFGRQSSLAIKFIKKSTEFCNSISFILPKSFKKDSLKRHIPLSFHLIYEYELPENSFIIDNNVHDVPCIFQIWIKKKLDRQQPKKLIPNNKYKFVKKEEEHDICFRRVGVYAGKIDRITKDKSKQSHYFIKFNQNVEDIILDKLKKINFDCKNNTCGPKSISKQELIKEFNLIL